MQKFNANVHRGIHFLSQEATDMMEAARENVRSFIGAGSTEEIIFTRGTTESINLLASSFSAAFLKEGDEVLISGMEHHSNIVPWQIQARRYGFRIKVVPVTDTGELDMNAFHSLLNVRTRLVSITHVSNVLGTVNPMSEIIREAHSKGIPVAVDGAQSVPHISVDVRELGADFYAFSGHKIYGPTGIGVLYGRKELLEKMPPYQGGGEMMGFVDRLLGGVFGTLKWFVLLGLIFHLMDITGLTEKVMRNREDQEKGFYPAVRDGSDFCLRWVWNKVRDNVPMPDFQETGKEVNDDTKVF